MTKRPAALVGAVVLSLVAVAGLVPFSTEEGGPRPTIRAHCNGVLIEAPPEPAGGGWFSYAPGERTIVASGSLRSSVCGHAARKRVVVPLMASAAVLLVVLWSLAWSARQPVTPVESGGP